MVAANGGISCANSDTHCPQKIQCYTANANRRATLDLFEMIACAVCCSWSHDRKWHHVSKSPDHNQWHPSASSSLTCYWPGKTTTPLWTDRQSDRQSVRQADRQVTSATWDNNDSVILKLMCGVNLQTTWLSSPHGQSIFKLNPADQR